MPDTLQVHDITVAETPVIGLAGGITRQVVVRYFVGDHGPFTDTYDATSYTPQQGRDAINKRVQDLRTLLAGMGT